MNPGRTSRKAEAFAAALEGAAVADPAVTALVGVAERLSSMPLRPGADFSAALRAQLVAQTPAVVAANPAPVATTAPAAAPTGALPAWVGGTVAQVVTGALAVAVGVAGTGVGASRSIPGDPLYAVKRAAERLQLAFADDALDEADALAEHVLARLDEISALLDGLSLPLDADVERLVADTLARLQSDLDELTRLLLAEMRAGSSRAADALAELSAAARMRLSALAAALPASVRDGAHAAVGSLDAAGDEAEVITRTPGPVVTPTVPVPATSAPTAPPSSWVPTPTDVPVLPTETPTVPLPSTSVPTVPVPVPTPTLPVSVPTPTLGLLPL